MPINGFGIGVELHIVYDIKWNHKNFESTIMLLPPYTSLMGQHKVQGKVFDYKFNE
jgi:hypothetical protein